ncbi:MAG TPA: non-homologous end-joining DNA ligase [Alphaproteobacteria bacterium]|nr:non-homologous end-joining DNA ligase [Alphaproteobacteria bacterium]
MLEEYKKKRDFKKTKEPKPKISARKKSWKKDGNNFAKDESIKSEKSTFVIQKHNATRLHFDFRFEHKGVLKSWAIPKGLSSNHSDKRLAVMVEDHPVSYANFSGTIPKGHYGAGTVEVWDNGKYVNITVKNGKVQPIDEALAAGHFILYLKGRKTEGTYAFTKIGGAKDVDTNSRSKNPESKNSKSNWIVVKKREDVKTKSELKIEGKIIQLTNVKKEVDKITHITKYELIDYYHNIAPLMLPHIKGRLISMLRFPEGVNGKKFFQKNSPDYFPEWLECKKVKHDSGVVCYTVVTDRAGIVYLANQVIVPHIMVTRIDDLEHPDKMIFDLDPMVENIKELKRIALKLKGMLEGIGLVPFIMTSGNKGYHIAVPIKRELKNDEVRDFALSIAKTLEKNDSGVTTQFHKNKRGNKIFIDVNRISSMQTSVCPYAARSEIGLPIACPFEWNELTNVDPKFYTIRNYPKTDAWKDFFKKAKSLKKIIGKLKK